WVPRFNIAPSQSVLAILDAEPRRAQPVRWGLVPFWAKDPKIGHKLINARSETAASKPAFREAYVRRRCLVPADGFYEWKKQGRSKIPFRIELESRRPFVFAGLWERWKGEGGAPLLSCTILT